MSWSKIHTRNDGFSEPGFYQRLLKGECTSTCTYSRFNPSVFSVQSKRTYKPCWSGLDCKINYCVVRKLISRRYGLNSIRCQIDITNRQYNLLLSKFAVTGKFKHFHGFVPKMSIVTTVYFGARSIRIDETTIQIKVISKPKVCIILIKITRKWNLYLRLTN